MTQSKKGSSILRVLEILELISEATTPIYPFDLATILKIPKPSVHRLLQQLEQEGFIRTDIKGSIVPGHRAMKVALGMWQSTQKKIVRETLLKELSNEIGETCGISFADGTDMVYGDRIQSNWPLQINLPIGSRVPMWCTASGKLFLSQLPEKDRKLITQKMPLTPFTKNTITDKTVLYQELNSISGTQLGIDNEEFVAGMVACAVPIYGQNNEFLAALYTHAPSLRKSLEDLITFVPKLRQTANELGEAFQEAFST